MAQSDLADAISEQLTIFAAASRVGWRAYEDFLKAGQNGDLAKAAELQLIASASMDSAMDAFMSCCRLQQQMQDADDS